MIKGYRIRDIAGNCPDCFIEEEMFERLPDARSWIDVNDGEWNIVPVTDEEMAGKAIYYSCIEEDVDWDEEWEQSQTENRPDL